jgi:hypothetical protein
MKRIHRLRIAMRLAADFGLVLQVQQLVDQLLPGHLAVYRELTGLEPQLPPMRIMVTADGLDEKGKIGVHVPPGDDGHFSVLKIHPKVFDQPGLPEQVVRHELIHYVANNDGKDPVHGELFNLMAERLGLPRELRD